VSESRNSGPVERSGGGGLRLFSFAATGRCEITLGTCMHQQLLLTTPLAPQSTTFAAQLTGAKKAGCTSPHFVIGSISTPSSVCMRQPSKEP